MCRQRRPLSTANKTFVYIGQRPTWPKCPGSQLVLIDSAVYSSGAVHLYTSSFSQTKTAHILTHCTCRTGHTYIPSLGWWNEQYEAGVMRSLFESSLPWQHHSHICPCPCNCEGVFVIQYVFRLQSVTFALSLWASTLCCTLHCRECVFTM